MEITFWGTRGSLPVAMTHADQSEALLDLLHRAKDDGAQTVDDVIDRVRADGLGYPLHHGGSTTCTEVRGGATAVYVDMGSGLRNAGTRDVQAGIKETHVLLTHMHWDHLIGLPFYIPLHVPGSRVIVHHVHKNAPDHVRLLFNGVNFPLKISDLTGSLEFQHHKLYDWFDIGDLRVAPFVLDHPGGCFGYRLEHDGHSVAIGVDGEFKRLRPDELGKDLPFYQNLDLLIFDAQYEMEELVTRFDWGHSSPPIGVDLALREGIRRLALTHHDPWATGEKLNKSLERARRYAQLHQADHAALWETRGQVGPYIFSAFDGLTIDLRQAATLP